MAALSNLKERGLFLVEVKITEYSPALGKLLPSIVLPESTRPVCVIRNGRGVTRLESLFLEEGDIVYLLSDDEETVRNLFTVII